MDWLPDCQLRKRPGGPARWPSGLSSRLQGSSPGPGEHSYPAEGTGALHGGVAGDGGGVVVLLLEGGEAGGGAELGDLGVAEGVGDVRVPDPTRAGCSDAAATEPRGPRRPGECFSRRRTRLVSSLLL